jgi:hypothetical protein
MGCPKPLFVIPFEMFPTSTDNLWKPLGRPVHIVGSSGFDFALTGVRVGGNARAIPAVSLIPARETMPDSPSAATGSYTSSQTTVHTTFSLSSATDKFLAQIGVFCNLSSGATPGYFAGILRADIAQCGLLVGRRKIEVSSLQDVANPSVYIIGRCPASGADKVRGALIIDGAKDIEFRVYARGVNDPDAPGAWVALGAGWTSITDGNTAVCYGDTAVSGVTPSDYHRLELAIFVRLKSGGSNPAGFITASLGMGYT